MEKDWIIRREESDGDYCLFLYKHYGLSQMDTIISFHHQRPPIPKQYVISQAAINFISSLSERKRVAHSKVYISADVTTAPIVSASARKIFNVNSSLLGGGTSWPRARVPQRYNRKLLRRDISSNARFVRLNLYDILHGKVGKTLMFELTRWVKLIFLVITI